MKYTLTLSRWHKVAERINTALDTPAEHRGNLCFEAVVAQGEPPVGGKPNFGWCFPVPGPDGPPQPVEVAGKGRNITAL